MILERHGHSTGRIERRVAAVELGKQVHAGIHGFALGHEGRADVHADIAFIVKVADSSLPVATHVRTEIQLCQEHP